MNANLLALLFQETTPGASSGQGTIRIVAGALAVILVVVVVFRRKRSAKKEEEEEF